MSRIVRCTPRQLDVLIELVRDGANDRMIASRLVITEDTVKSHLKVLYHRSGTRSRCELAVAVLREAIYVVPSNGGGLAHEF